MHYILFFNLTYCSYIWINNSKSTIFKISKQVNEKNEHKLVSIELMWKKY